MRDVMLWTGAGQIGMAIARRVGFNQKIIVRDKNFENAKNIAKIMTEAGFDIKPIECDISDRKSILGLIKEGQKSIESTNLHLTKITKILTKRSIFE